MEEDHVSGTPQSTDDEIRSRLAQLRGQTSVKEPSRSFLVSGRKKTQAEEAEDLLKQFSAEAQLVKQFNETSIDVDKQIEERLRRLKADTASLTPQTNPISAKVLSQTFAEQCSDDSDDDDIKADAIIRKILAEEELARREIHEELGIDDKLDQLDDPDDLDDFEEFR
nr:PREDICTED: uncharacterized protein LOC109031051 [Bemisia tabaci]